MRNVLLMCGCLLAAPLFVSSESASPLSLAKQALAMSNQERTQAKNTLLFKSARLGNQDAKDALLDIAIESKSTYWLAQLANLDSARAAYQRGLLSQTERKQKHWFKQASELGHAAAMFELSLILDDHKQRLTLLQKAAQLNYAPAVITFSQYLDQEAYDQDLEDLDLNKDVDTRTYWLQKAAKIDAQSAFSLAMLYLKNGDKQSAIETFTRAAEQGFDDAQAYTEVLQSHSRSDVDALYSQPLPTHFAHQREARQCAQVLQFVATSLASMVQAKSFVRAFESDERISSLPICLNAPIWLNESALTCESSINEGRINCDLSAISKYALAAQTPPPFTHLVVFAPSGKAYVQRGVMYLDALDTYSVFVHELAHFANFVDEYPLSSTLAEQFCFSSQAPNLLLEDAQGKVDKLRLSALKRLTDASIAPSKTCSSLGISAYKPSTDITFLEYHDIDYIPQAYVDLWRAELQHNHGKIAFADEMLF